MAKRKYRQYIPGRTPGVHSIITAVRDTDLTEVDGKTRLKPGESITFEFDLMAGVRSYTQWKSLARQIACGACTLKVVSLEAQADGAGDAPVVHAIPPQETTTELTREQEVIAAAKAKDSSIIAKTIDPQEGQHDPVFQVQAPELPTTTVETLASVTIQDSKAAMDELPGPAVETKPSIMYSAEPPAPRPTLSMDEKQAPEVVAPETTLVPETAVESPVESTEAAKAQEQPLYNPEQAQPTDYSQVKRTRSKKAK